MFASGLIVMLWAYVVPSTLAAGVTALAVELLRLAGVGPWYVWLLLAPSLYLCWLVSFLFFCAKSIATMGKRFPKPRRATVPGAGAARLRMVFASSVRMNLIRSLPLVPFLQGLRWGSRLTILSYSPSLHIGQHVSIVRAFLEDPDLTELGDYVTLGAGTVIAAHFWGSLPNGSRVFITAPVKVGARATVGAYSTVTLGCTIGQDAVIEPHSYVEPHTQVPAGEIWGGRPAVFLRKRAAAQDSPMDTDAQVGQAAVPGE